MTSLHILLDDDSTQDGTLLQTRWKDACKRLKQLRNDAFDYRVVHLANTLQKYIKIRDDMTPTERHKDTETSDKIRRIRSLINTENMRKPFRAIHSSMSRQPNGGLSKLFVPAKATNAKVAARFCGPDGSVTPAQLIQMAQSDRHSVAYDTLLDCTDIEATLMDYNRQWFCQAAETPFGHGKLFDMVGFDGLTEEADAIISGECIAYMGIPVSPELQAFLEECKRPDNVQSISSEIDLATYTKLFASGRKPPQLLHQGGILVTIKLRSSIQN